MSRWIEIPAKRVLLLDEEDSLDDWECLNSDGAPCGEYEVPTLMVRKRDRKVFKPARFRFDQGVKYCLEEI